MDLTNYDIAALREAIEYSKKGIKKAVENGNVPDKKLGPMSRWLKTLEMLDKRFLDELKKDGE